MEHRKVMCSKEHQVGRVEGRKTSDPAYEYPRRPLGVPTIPQCSTGLVSTGSAPAFRDNVCICIPTPSKRLATFETVDVDGAKDTLSHDCWVSGGMKNDEEVALGKTRKETPPSGSYRRRPDIGGEMWEERGGWPMNLLTRKMREHHFSQIEQLSILHR
ncbi:hypothetical protein AAG570_000692 [Ranatra chinensis]|uniref:Uncharacterized protein n=1 Tax=Ranatra chinensis TaxID=642074 RepID=A0ABD0YXU7_9HEMI